MIHKGCHSNIFPCCHGNDREAADIKWEIESPFSCKHASVFVCPTIWYAPSIYRFETSLIHQCHRNQNIRPHFSNSTTRRHIKFNKARHGGAKTKNETSGNRIKDKHEGNRRRQQQRKQQSNRETGSTHRY